MNKFLTNWIHYELDYLWINCPYYDFKYPIQTSYYLDSLIKSMRKVTKEIFLTLFDLSIFELEQIIKAACNWERLVLFWCDLKWSSSMNIMCTSTYKTTVD